MTSCRHINYSIGNEFTWFHIQRACSDRSDTLSPVALLPSSEGTGAEFSCVFAGTARGSAHGHGCSRPAIKNCGFQHLDLFLFCSINCIFRVILCPCVKSCFVLAVAAHCPLSRRPIVPGGGRWRRFQLSRELLQTAAQVAVPCCGHA